MEEKSLFKIVLTGGPCAGKTTALARIEETLTEEGYKVLIVGESATELIKGGIRPFGVHKFDIIKFQDLILKYQLQKEMLYEEAARSLDSEKIVIIYDRGILDNKAYIKDDEFTSLLENLNLSEIELMDNYDLVLHLVTAADGKEECYTLANNQARSESASDAKKLDSKTLNAWNGHPNLRIIGNETHFEEKINRVMNEVHNLLGVPIKTRKQRKYIVDLSTLNNGLIDINNITTVFIEQIYLESLNDNYEKRLRKRTINGVSTYYFTSQKKECNGSSLIITDKKITEKEYYNFMETSSVKKRLTKIRKTFSYDKNYYRLDTFENGLCILEVEENIDPSVVKLPDFINIIKDVTDDENYRNLNIATESITKKLN